MGFARLFRREASAFGETDKGEGDITLALAIPEAEKHVTGVK